MGDRYGCCCWGGRGKEGLIFGGIEVGTRGVLCIFLPSETVGFVELGTCNADLDFYFMFTLQAGEIALLFLNTPTWNKL